MERTWSDKSDADLVVAARAGDTFAADALFRRHEEAARRVARRNTNSEAAAEEATQAGMAVAFAKLGTLEDPNRFRAWLSAIVRNEAVNEHRWSARNVASADLPEAPAAEPDPAVAAVDAEQQDRANQSYLGLPERHRRAADLAWRDNRSVPEVAAALGVDVNTAHQLLFRARKGLRRAYLVHALRSDAPEPCQRFTRALIPYLRGTLDLPERLAVEDHAAECEACAARLEAAAEEAGLIKGAFGLLPLAGGGLWRAIRLGGKRVGRSPGRSAVATGVGAGMAVAITVAVALAATTGHPPPARAKGLSVGYRSVPTTTAPATKAAAAKAAAPKAAAPPHRTKPMSTTTSTSTSTTEPSTTTTTTTPPSTTTTTTPPPPAAGPPPAASSPPAATTTTSTSTTTTTTTTTVPTTTTTTTVPSTTTTTVPPTTSTTTTTAPSTTTTTAPPPPGVLLTGNGTSVDARHHHNATWNGLPTYLPGPGTGTQAFAFTGTNGLTDGAPKLGAANFTVSFDLLTGSTGKTDLLGYRNACSGGDFFDVRLDAGGSTTSAGKGKVLVELDGGTSADQVVNLASHSALDNGKWHQVQITRAGSTVTLSIDGHTEDTATAPARLDVSDSSPWQVANGDPCAAPSGDGTSALVGEMADIYLGPTAGAPAPGRPGT